MTHQCPVCGYPSLEEAPRTEDNGGSYETCASCGFEFGVTDEDRGFTYEAWRARWISGGMQWRSEGIQDPPNDWDPAVQLRDLLRQLESEQKIFGGR
jgi:ribosomal protein L37E